MKPMLAVVAAVALFAAPTTALGHVSLVSSAPRAGQDLTTAPTLVTLTFDGELDPLESGFAVRGPQGGEVGVGTVDLQVADRNVLSGSVGITQPGIYTVEWAVVGTDGHEITGSFSFGYATDQEVPSTTARPATPRSPLPPLGIALLALAGLIAVRRRTVG
jgi:MYXO-CTERM domain-containing protein